MALERVAQLVHDRTEHPTAPVDDRATAEHHNVQPREEPDHVSADRADEVAIEQRRSRCPPGKHKNPAGAHWAEMIVPTFSPARARVSNPGLRS